MAADTGPGEHRVAHLETILLPDIGDFAAVEVVEIQVAPGDRIDPEQPILTLESDKATMEIPAPRGGVVKDILVKVGDKISAGRPLLTLVMDGTVTDTYSMPTTPFPPSPQPQPQNQESTELGETIAVLVPDIGDFADLAAIAPGRMAHASPTVRRLARELGVELTLVRGAGPKGRILKEDVQGYVKRALTQGVAAPAVGTLPFDLPATIEVDFSRFGPIEVGELPRIQKLSGRHLHRCWLSVPHVTQFDEADITELESFRRSQQGAAEAEGVKLTFLPFLLKAVATALNRMPTFKASLTPDGEGLVLKHYTHVGVAVDTPNGLVVPVLREVDKKGVYDLARELTDFSQKARDGRLLPGDMQGGCFTISSLGGLGGTAFTPIVNAPEVAILGVSRSATKPVWNGKEFNPRLMLPLSLSYDHRVIDGAAAARFTCLLGRFLGDIRQLLL
jgi:pyruvate dehydrogenase E2 component (dihydrolipoamide acetyltransferase)